MDARPGGSQRGEGWSPTLVGDYHVPDRFGRVTFRAPQVAADGTAVPMLHLDPAQLARIRPIVPQPVFLPQGSTQPVRRVDGPLPH
jgi:hypothetical protein